MMEEHVVAAILAIVSHWGAFIAIMAVNMAFDLSIFWSSTHLIFTPTIHDSICSSLSSSLRFP